MIKLSGKIELFDFLLPVLRENLEGKETAKYDYKFKNLIREFLRENFITCDTK